jgi:hypothetical protein
MKFYPADWRSDPKLRMCSIGARGLWVEMLCVMHEAEPYGYLISNGRAITSRQMAGLAGVTAGECMKYLLELASAGVYSLDDEKIFSRRMVRDKAKADSDRENGKGGGNPKLKVTVKVGVNPPDKAQKPETRDQIQKDSAADAAGAGAPIDHRKRLFDEGLPKLAAMTGKGPDAVRSFVGKCLSAAGDDAVTVLGLIEDAERNHVVNPSSWIAARLKPTEISNGRRTVHDAAADLAERLGALDEPAPSGLRGPEGKGAVRLLPAR